MYKIYRIFNRIYICGGSLKILARPNDLSQIWSFKIRRTTDSEAPKLWKGVGRADSLSRKLELNLVLVFSCADLRH